MIVKRSQAEIDAVLNRCSDWENYGKNPFFGMTYSQGVQAGIDWLLGNTDEGPLD